MFNDIGISANWILWDSIKIFWDVIS